MKRTPVTVTLEIVDGDEIAVIGRVTTYAFNSGIRASEGLARDYARSIGRILVGDTPQRHGDTYSRVWRNGDTKLIATVTR